MSAPEKIVASVDYEIVSGMKMRMGVITVGTEGVPSPFEPAHYVRKDIVEEAVAQARREALEEAAAFCEARTMETPMRHQDRKWAGMYTDGEATGGTHEGKGYAAAIRALIDKETRHD